MITTFQIEELKRHTAQINHLDKDLFSHLMGTFNILKDKGKPDYVCIAGLYHSVYETEYFQFNSPFTREKVKSLIGEKSENLVFEFCNTVPRVTKLIEREGNWSDELYGDLLDIELANMIEQGYYNDTIKIMEGIRKFLIVRKENV